MGYMYFNLISLSCTAENTFCLRVYLEALQTQSKGGGVFAAAGLQLQLLDFFWSKVLRLKDDAKIRVCMSRMLEPVDSNVRACVLQSIGFTTGTRMVRGAWAACCHCVLRLLSLRLSPSW